MYIDEDGFEWGERGDQIGSVYLFTNRTLMVFTPEGYQIPDYQKSMDKKLLKEIATNGKKFYITQFRGWINEITREEFMALLQIK